MADLEAVLADVSYLMAMEKSKSTPAARASKKIILPDPRLVQNVSFTECRCTWNYQNAVNTYLFNCMTNPNLSGILYVETSTKKYLF